MSEHKIPIPSMIYNAAVGGHVTNSQQIIDENLNREQNDINQETVGAIPYNSTTPNGMGRIVLKKNDDFKQIIEAQTNGNTIFVIKYDFTLTDNVTIPANCVLEFDGGSVSGITPKTININNADIISPLNCIFKNVIISGTYKKYFEADWFENLNECVDNIDVARPKIHLSDKPYGLTKTLILKNSTSLIGTQTFEYDWKDGTIIGLNDNVDTSVNTCVIKILSDDSGSAVNINIENIVIYGDGTDSKNPTVNGIICPSKLHSSCFKNVHVYRCIKAYSFVTLWDCSFENCNSYMCTNGLYFNNAYGNTSTIFNRCVIYGGDIAIYFAGGICSASFYSCAIDSCRIGLEIDCSGYLLFEGLSIESMEESAIVIDNANVSVLFSKIGLTKNNVTPTNHTTYIKNIKSATFINCSLEAMPVTGKDVFYTETTASKINFINSDLGDYYDRYSTVVGSFKRNGEKTIIPKQYIKIPYEGKAYHWTHRVKSQFVQIDATDGDSITGAPSFIYEGAVGDVIEIMNVMALNQILHKNTESYSTGLLLDEDITLKQYESVRLVYLGNSQFKLAKYY